LKSAICNQQSPIIAPLAFDPIFVERIWGGRRLESELHKKLPPEKRIGESWEIVDRPEAQSVVSAGPLRGTSLHELWTQHLQEFFGDVPDTTRIPLLIKIIDAHENLSLQVHPSKDIADRLGGEPKSEFWYVVGADPEAALFLGFRHPVTPQIFEETLRNGTVIDQVHRIAIETGDAVFLPAGRLHAIGAGNLLIEIQQNSDTTYRTFDWNRSSPGTGRKRDLHVEQAIQCIDFEDVQPALIESKHELLLEHELFGIQKWTLPEPREAIPLGQFAIVCCLTGNVSCAKTNFTPGQFFLIPAHLEERHLKPMALNTSVLRVTIPKP
jgi:mannose-6-phosphate isomerase